MKKNVVIFAFVVSFSGSSLAEGEGFFLSAGIGSSGIDTEIGNDTQFPLSITPTGNSIFLKGGYSFDKFFSMDLTYHNYGDVEFKSLGNGTYSWDPKSLSINTNLSYPVFGFISPFISVGAGYISLNETENQIKNDSELSFRYGAGVEFNSTKFEPITLTIGYSAERLTLESTRKDYDVTFDSYYVNANYEF
ncbi:porin family protein [Vibrio cyclitrophicus]|uniref:porin family protein n=1 Tax=Vibrio cyclitrophicus TaxID=47951 RepID=UPI0011B4C9DB|nr:porin family protein [Vibrio cyclitrophicus]